MSGLVTHTVRRGETLRTIARDVYPDDPKGDRWIVIFRFNKHVIADPNQLNPGTQIVIPHVSGRD